MSPTLPTSVSSRQPLATIRFHYSVRRYMFRNASWFPAVVTSFLSFSLVPRRQCWCCAKVIHNHVLSPLHGSEPSSKKLIFAHLVQEFPFFHLDRRFIIVFLESATDPYSKPVEFLYTPTVRLLRHMIILLLHFCLGLASGHVPQGLIIEVYYIFCLSSMRATDLIRLYFITLMVFSGDYKSLLA
jgi:hypothetical protein